MVTFLFWNSGNRDLGPLVARSAMRHRLDPIVLAESAAIQAGKLLSGLDSGREPDFFSASSGTVTKENAMCPDAYDLWPADLRAGKTKAPATILREQGTLLGRKTNNLLLGRVRPAHGEGTFLQSAAPWSATELERLGIRSVPEEPSLPETAPRPARIQSPAERPPQRLAALPFAYSFYIVAPVLDNYAFELFSIRHGVDLYPVFITMSQRPRRKLKAATEAEFLKHLRAIFASEETRRVIESLLAQSQAPV